MIIFKERNKLFFIVNLIISFIISYGNCNAKEENMLIFDYIKTDQMPRNYRSMNNINIDHINKEGLDSIQASASAQFNLNQLNNIRESFSPYNLIILDLRQESHGFINNIPISWYGEHNWANIDKTPEEINIDEYEKFLILESSKNRVIDIFDIVKDSNKEVKIFDNNILIENVSTEKSAVETIGAKYVRFYVTDHMIPKDNLIDEFVNLILNLKSSEWLHIHCKAGKGRTTSFLTMYDIIKNAKKISLDEIIYRQFIIGGINLKNTSVTQWKKDQIAERLRFIEKFYQYALLNNDNFSTKWSSYINN